jgi:hypothetical protein
MYIDKSYTRVVVNIAGPSVTESCPHYFSAVFVIQQQRKRRKQQQQQSEKGTTFFHSFRLGFFFFRGVHGHKPGTKKNEPKFLGSVEQSKSEIIGHRCTGTNRLYGCCYKYFTPYNRPEKKKLKIKVQLS